MAMKPPNALSHLAAAIAKHCNHELADVVDYVTYENRTMRGKFGKRVPLTNTERKALARYASKIKSRLAEFATVAKPETILGWNRGMKRKKWPYGNTPKRPGGHPRARIPRSWWSG